MPEQVSAAEAYHRVKRREREIAELQEEIGMLVNFLQCPLAQHYEEQAEVYRRICVRLRAALAELQRGMKGAQ